jgi:hypothetical protein
MTDGKARLILAAAALLVIFSLLARTAADADLWGHLTFGRDILASGRVHQRDTYSFTSDRPWINHEWLAEALMAGAYQAGGIRGLVGLKVALVWLAGLFVVWSWREWRLSEPWRDGLLFLVALGVWPLVATIRPQVFSAALFAALLFALGRVRAGARGWLAGVPAVMALWVNVHGGWVVGAGAIGAFTTAAMVDPAFDSRRRLGTAAMAAASAAACLANPYGVGMLAFLAGTVRPDRADVLEWQPVTALPPVALALWLIPAALTVIGLWRGRRSVPLWGLLVVLGLALGSLRVARLVGFFAVAAGMLVAPDVAGVRRRAGDAGPTALRGYGLVAAAAAFAAVALVGGRISMDAPWTPEPGAAAFVAGHALRGRMLTWFDYGEYAIWHFAPSVTVSMDGRRETVYSSAMRAAHQRIYTDAPGALDDVARLAPDYVWLPRAAPVLPRLVAAGWRALYRGPRSVILGRDQWPTDVDEGPVPEGRGFPGP